MDRMTPGSIGQEKAQEIRVEVQGWAKTFPEEVMGLDRKDARGFDREEVRDAMR